MTTCIMGAGTQKLRTSGTQRPLTKKKAPQVIQKFQAGKSRTFLGLDLRSHGQSVQSSRCSCSLSDFSECLLFGPQKESTLGIWPHQPPRLNPLRSLSREDESLSFLSATALGASGTFFCFPAAPPVAASPLSPAVGAPLRAEGRAGWSPG